VADRLAFARWLQVELGRSPTPGPHAAHGEGEGPGADSDADHEVGGDREDHTTQRQRDHGQDDEFYFSSTQLCFTAIKPR
jgi:hypothetical protein